MAEIRSGPPLEGRPSEAPGSDLLVGVDGNAFSVMGAVSRALKRAGASREYVSAYMSAAMSGDYDNLLAVSVEFLEAN